LDNISAFCSENYLGKLTKLVRKASKPLEQGFVPVGAGCSHRQYKRITVNDISISVQLGNNCLTLNDNVVLVRNILVKDNDARLVYHKFSKYSNFFSHSLLGIF